MSATEWRAPSSPGLRGLAAIEHHLRAGHERVLVGGQRQREGGDFFRGGEAGDRRGVVLEPLVETDAEDRLGQALVARRLAQELGVGGAGNERVDADALWGVVERRRLAQA